jgi:hypothetical protein
MMAAGFIFSFGFMAIAKEILQPGILNVVW